MMDHRRPYEMAQLFLKMLFLMIYPFFLLSINNMFVQNKLLFFHSFVSIVHNIVYTEP